MVQFNDNLSNKRLKELRDMEAERYVQSMAPQLGFDHINLQGYTINPEALAIIPEHKAQKAQLVGFDLKNGVIYVAAKTPGSPAVQAIVSDLTNNRYQVRLFICSQASLEHAWKRYKDVRSTTTKQKGVLEIDPEKVAEMMAQIKKTEDVEKVLLSIRTANSARRISETMQLIFAGALALGVSDIHIEREELGIRLRYRFDGILHDIADMEPFMHERLMSRLKLLSSMKLNRSAEAQDGRFTFDLGEKEIEIRSSVIPGALGESIVMRVLDPSVANFSLENIDLTPKLREVIMEEISKPNGLILTTGPTGSGKTTLLYAFLRQTHEEGVKIITIENPVEYKIEGIVQTQIEGDYTFASGLRALLRQDPDVIMVGEIRDHIVAETAIHAAQTGHLVFSTLHTNSAVASFSRLIDLGIEARSLGTSINLIIGQRLVRVLCEHCKKRRAANASETALIRHLVSTHPQPPTLPDPITVCEAVGCTACDNTGYKGRAGVYEAVRMDQFVEEAILRDPRENVILEAAKQQQIPSMAEDGIGKVLNGITSIEELSRVVNLPTVTTTPATEDTLANQAQNNQTEKNTPESEDDFFAKHVV